MQRFITTKATLTGRDIVSLISGKVLASYSGFRERTQADAQALAAYNAELDSLDIGADSELSALRSAYARLHG